MGGLVNQGSCFYQSPGLDQGLDPITGFFFIVKDQLTASVFTRIREIT